MKMTLIEMVQDIANDLDSDEINSFSDTTESMQIAQIIKTCFFETIGRKEWQHLRKMTTLESVSDATKPNFLKLPELAVRMDMLKYNQQKVPGDRMIQGDVDYMYPDQFMAHTNPRNTDNPNVVSVDGFDGIVMHILDDQAPSRWTSFDDQHIVFDSYVADQGVTLVGSESQCLLYFSPSWTMADDFVPDLPVEAFPAFLAEAKSTASLALRQIASEKAEQQSTRQHNMLAQRGFVTKGGIRYRSFGRRSGKMHGRHNPLFDRNSYTGGS